MSDPICPLVKKACLKEGCMFYHELIFNHPTDGTRTQRDCVVKWIPVLLIENAKETRHCAASVDKVANETNAAAGSILMKLIGAKLPDETPALEKKP